MRFPIARIKIQALSLNAAAEINKISMLSNF